MINWNFKALKMMKKKMPNLKLINLNKRNKRDNFGFF